MPVDLHGYCLADHALLEGKIDAVRGDANRPVIYPCVVDDFAGFRISLILIVGTTYYFRHMSLDILTPVYVGIKFPSCADISAHSQYT